MTLNVAFSASQHYAITPDSPRLPWVVLLLATAQLCLVPIGFIALNRLFKLFEQGIFFSSNNARYLKIVGLTVTGCGLTQTILELLSTPMGLDVNLLLVGGLVMLLAWILDEARKLREEQDLTV
jgi:hypothetical protein